MTIKLKTRLGTIQVDDFTYGYITAALWTSPDIEPGQGEYSPNPDDIARIDGDTLMTLIDTCSRFQDDNACDLNDYLEQRPASGNYSASECAGHDFYLTQTRQGTGFWDRDVSENLRDRLTEAAHRYPEGSLYQGDSTLFFFS